MGLLDYEYPERDTEFYYLKNTTTNLFFAGFSKETRNKPLWVEKKEDATFYKESKALCLQRRLEIQYLPYQKIIMVEK